MRIHDIPLWPPVAFQPAQKQEKLRKAKTSEQLKSFAVGGRSVQTSKDEDEGDDSPNERTDILA
jgi:hypothetical protein